MINDKFTCIGLLSIFVIIVGLLLYKLYNNKLIVQENFQMTGAQLTRLEGAETNITQIQEDAETLTNQLTTLSENITDNLSTIGNRLGIVEGNQDYTQYLQELGNINSQLGVLTTDIANLSTSLSTSTTGLSDAIESLSGVPELISEQITSVDTTLRDLISEKADDSQITQWRDETTTRISDIIGRLNEVQEITIPGLKASLEAKISTEAQAREAANNAEAKAREVANNAEAQAREAANNAEAQARGVDVARLNTANTTEKTTRESEVARLDAANTKEKDTRESEVARLDAANTLEKTTRESEVARLDAANTTEKTAREDKDKLLDAANTKERQNRMAKDDLLDQEDIDERLARIAANNKERQNRIAKDILLDEEDISERKSRIHKDDLLDIEMDNLKNSWNELETSTEKKLKLYGNKLTQIQDIISNSDKQQELRLNEFEKLADDLNAKKMNIGQQYRDFSTSIKELGQFHDNYQKELESILDRRYNLGNAEYKLRKDRQSQKLDKIEQSLRNLKPQQNQNTNQSFKSIKNHGSGNILNVAKVLKHDNKYNIFIKDSSQQTKCLNTINPTSPNNNGIIGIDTPSLQQCNGADKNQNFLIKKINNSYEYNELIGLDDTEINKKRPEDEEHIKYPFYVVTPKEEVNRGWCLNIGDDKNASIQSCSSSAYQRFNPMYSDYDPHGSC